VESFAVEVTRLRHARLRALINNRFISTAAKEVAALFVDSVYKRGSGMSRAIAVPSGPRVDSN
jgi:hypothetical protein